MSPIQDDAKGPFRRADSGPAPASSILVGRIPVFNKKLELFAYELNGDPQQEGVEQTHSAKSTASLLVQAFVDIGWERVAGSQPVLIRPSKDFITGMLPLPVADRSVLIELPSGITGVNSETEDLIRLARAGYSLVLRDYHPDIHSPALLEIVHFVKLNIQSPEYLQPKLISELRKFPAKLVAYNVDTPQQLHIAQDLGFDYLQGYFFCKPELIQGKRPQGSRFALLRLLQQVQSPQTDLVALKRLISQDVSISYRLIRCLNSPNFSLAHPVSTVGQAVSLLGERKVRQWVTLMALTGMQDKPHELHITATVRAGMCEVLGICSGLDSPSLFTTGLFSVLDALMDQELSSILENMPLSPEISNGLLHGKGKEGEILRCVVAFERGDWSAARSAGFSDAQLNRAWLTAVSWAEAMRSMLTGN